MVDCHIAPYNHTEYSGERMLAAAALAGLGDPMDPLVRVEDAVHLGLVGEPDPKRSPEGARAQPA